MKRLLMIAVAMLPFVVPSPVLAANWTDGIQAAIKSGDFSQIDVVAAKNPEDEGDIAMYLLRQSQNNALNQNIKVKLFDATTPFGSQILPGDATEAGKIIQAMLNLAGDPGFQSSHHPDAAGIIVAALSMSDQPNIVAGNPNIHEAALALANDFSGTDPNDKNLQDQVDLALQVGLPPPLGPRGIINPSGE